jgi:hypothetical protein
MDLMVRTVRITQRTVSRLVALGYLERGGDERAEGIAIEAYLGDGYRERQRSVKRALLTNQGIRSRW